MTKTIVGVFFLTFLALTARSANAKRAALPRMTDPACNGAVAIDKLVTIDVSKTDLASCPKGLRSPYLCAMHKAGYSQRSLGYAMRHTIADLGDGTCGRVNLQGTLVYYKSGGSAVEGSTLVDPRVEMPETGLRFGAWKSYVLYVSAGDAELAMCKAELTSCRAAASPKPAAKETVCPECPKTSCPKTECPKCKKCPKTTTVEAPRCPTIECPVFDAKPLHAEIRTLTAARDAFQARVNALNPVQSVIEQCKTTRVPYDPESGQCINTTQLARFLDRASNDRIDELVAQVRSLRTTMREINTCIAGGRRFNFTGDTTGWCPR